MNDQMVIVDSSAADHINESPILVVGLAWVLALGSVVIAALILCGWRGAKQVAFDWLHWKATFYCR